MKKLFLLLSILAFAFVSNAQPICPTGNLPQNAKWSFNFSQCMKDSLYMTYMDTSKIMYIDANGVVTTISYADLLDSLNVQPTTPNGGQWAIQLNDSGNFGSSENFKYDDDEGVFYVLDFNGDTLFSVNTQTQEIRSRGTFSLNLPDSTLPIIDGNGNLVADSVNLLWDNVQKQLLLRNSSRIPYTRTVFNTYGGTGAQGSISIGVSSNSGTQTPRANFHKSRGTITAPTLIQSNDELGGLHFQGYDGSVWNNAGVRLDAIVSQNWSTANHSAYFRFRVVAKNTTASSPVTGMLILDNATVAVGPGVDIGDSTAGLTVAGPTLTGSMTEGAIRIRQTWNTSGNPTGIFANFTNTASGASTNIIDLRVSNVSRFTVSKAGALTGLATIQTSSVGIFGTGGTVVGDGSSMLYQNSTANGFLRAVSAGNWSLSSVNFLSLGGVTSSFPAIKRSSTVLQVRLADDSGFAPIEAGNATVNNILTITPQTAAQASAITPALGMFVVVSDTNGTFTQVGAWFYNGSAWVALH